VFFGTYRWDGSPLGANLSIPAYAAPGFDFAVGLARLMNDSYLLAWTPGEQGARGVVTAIVDASGEMLVAPREIYRSSTESLICCRVSPTAGGNALIAWEESSGDRSRIMALEAGTSGAVGSVQQLNFRVPVSLGEGDDVRPRVVLAGQHNVVAWGTRFQSSERAPQKIAVRVLDGQSPVHVFDLPGELFGNFSLAATDDAIALAVLTEGPGGVDRGGVQVHTAVLPLASLR
jgi:hypothetical protein